MIYFYRCLFWTLLFSNRGQELATGGMELDFLIVVMILNGRLDVSTKVKIDLDVHDAPFVDKSDLSANRLVHFKDSPSDISVMSSQRYLIIST